MSIEREFWLILIYILTAGGLAWGLQSTKRIVEAPFLYAVGMLLIICPQFYVATYNVWRVPEQAFRVFSIMTVLCTIALYWGYVSGGKAIKRKQYSPPNYRWIIDDNRLFNLGLFIGILGTFGSIQVRSFGEIEGLWRGWPVYWYTLSKLALPGISLILISYFQSGKLYRLICALSLSFFPLQAIVVYGRRTMSFVLPFTYLLPMLIYKPKLRIPRWAIAGALVLSFVIVYALPYWRGEFKQGQYFDIIRERPIPEIVNDIFSGEQDKTLEVIDGMIVAGAYFETNNYGFGIDRVYNSVIHRYVPGGLIGRALKDSLFIGAGTSRDWVGDIYGIPVSFYTAKTAFSEVFGEFSFFGCILFFYVGYFFRRTHHAATHYFDGRAIIFLCFFITFPAGLPYGSMLTFLVGQLPNIMIMVIAFKWCLVKQYLVASASQDYDSYYSVESGS